MPIRGDDSPASCGAEEGGKLAFFETEGGKDFSTSSDEPGLKRGLKKDGAARSS